MPELEWWIPQLPRILSATTAILLFQTRDQSALGTKTKDRVLVQVVLWLIASTTEERVGHEPAHEFEALLHVTFFATLIWSLLVCPPAATPAVSLGMHITKSEGSIQHYSAFGLCCPRQSERLHGYNGTNSRTSLRSSLLFFSSKIPFSLWVSLILSYLEHGHTNLEGVDLFYRYTCTTGAVFVLTSLAAHWMQEYQARLQKRNYQHFPEAVTEEHNWYQWTVPQVTAWLTQLDKHHSLRDLAVRQAIDGLALDLLDMEALRHMGIPYGVACRLLDARTRLARRYPRPESFAAMNNQSTVTGRFSMENEFSSLDSPRRSQPKQYLDDKELEQARNSVMQRFGFHLPELRKGEADPPKAELETPSSSAAVKSAIDDALLSTMPPHIREIVRQKPHLWQQQVQASHEGEHKNIGSETMSSIEVGESKNVAVGKESLLSSDDIPPRMIPEEILNTLPANVREIAERNPQVFWKLFHSKQNRPVQTEAAMEATTELDSADQDEDVDDETMQLIPTQPSPPRVKPGF